MKTRISLFIVLTLALGACKSYKHIGNEIKEPFDGKNYQSNNRFFRSTGQGESINLGVSKEKAMLNAKQRLASGVQTTMKAVTDRYLNERQTAGKGEVSEKFESLTRESLNQVIADVGIIGEKTFQREDKTYITYVALEAKKKKVYERLELIYEQKKELLQFDKEAYRRAFEAEGGDLSGD